MWDQGSEGWGWDQSPGIRDHKPWYWDQQFLRDQGSGCTIGCGIRDQNLPCFWDQGSEIWTRKWDQR